MQITEKRLEDIKPYQNNPRKNDDAVYYVANSIKQFGFQVPIVIDRDGVIVAGHTRYKAAERLGLDVVPCVVADNLTPEQIKAYRIADNKVSEFARWDFELLNEEISDIPTIDMEEFGFFDYDIDWDNVAELTEDEYKEPEHDMLECPKCHHIDIKMHFKKVKGVEEETQNNED